MHSDLGSGSNKADTTGDGQSLDCGRDRILWVIAVILSVVRHGVCWGGRDGLRERRNRKMVLEVPKFSGRFAVLTAYSTAIEAWGVHNTQQHQRNLKHIRPLYF
jgi:hypothetical protein